MTIIHKPYIGLQAPPTVHEDDLLYNMLPSRGLGFLVGEPGVCKSFLALKLCASLATGACFIHEEHILKGSAPCTGISTGYFSSLYIAGEREDGLVKRQKALINSLRNDYELSGYPYGLPIITCAIRGHAYDALSRDVPFIIKKEKEELETQGYPLKLIILDTLQSAIHTPNENGNTEMQYTMNALRNLADSLGCFILIITHPAQNYGRSGSYALKGVPRGATSMRGTADIIWYMEKTGNNGLCKLTVTKGSEGYCEGHSFYYALTPYEDSAALVPIESPPDKTHTSNDDSKDQITQNDLGVLKAMLHAKAGVVVLDEMGNAYSHGATRETIYTKLKELHIKEATKEGRKAIGESAIGNRVTRGLERLLEAKLITYKEEEDENVYYPAKSWADMCQLLETKFPSVNFAKISFL